MTWEDCPCWRLSLFLCPIVSFFLWSNTKIIRNECCWASVRLCLVKQSFPAIVAIWGCLLLWSDRQIASSFQIISSTFHMCFILHDTWFNRNYLPDLLVIASIRLWLEYNAIAGGRHSVCNWHLCLLSPPLSSIDSIQPIIYFEGQDLFFLAFIQTLDNMKL